MVQIVLDVVTIVLLICASAAALVFYMRLIKLRDAIAIAGQTLPKLDHAVDRMNAASAGFADQIQSEIQAMDIRMATVKRLINDLEKRVRDAEVLSETLDAQLRKARKLDRSGNAPRELAEPKGFAERVERLAAAALPDMVTEPLADLIAEAAAEVAAEARAEQEASAAPAAETAPDEPTALAPQPPPTGEQKRAPVARDMLALASIAMETPEDIFELPGDLPQPEPVLSRFAKPAPQPERAPDQEPQSEFVPQVIPERVLEPPADMIRPVERMEQPVTIDQVAAEQPAPVQNRAARAQPAVSRFARSLVIAAPEAEADAAAEPQPAAAQEAKSGRLTPERVSVMSMAAFNSFASGREG